MKFILKNKIIFFIIFTYSNLSFAFFPKLPDFPELPKIGEFDPKILQDFYNQYTEVQPNYEREKRMIGEIEDAVMDGDVEYLPIGDDKEVFSIYMEGESENPKGGVIVVHSRGYHANWDSVVKPVRIGLAEKGWSTLSVQMPVLEKSAKYYDYVPIFPYAHERIDAAINFYKQRGIDNIILIGHGCGAHMTMSYIDKYGDDKLAAYVGIGMGATDFRQKLVKQFPLDKMLSPTLDIFGENDFPGVKRMSEYRKGLLDIAGNKKSTQLVVEKADHYYKEGETAEDLVDTIDAWLNGLKL